MIKSIYPLIIWTNLLFILLILLYSLNLTPIMTMIFLIMFSIWMSLNLTKFNNSHFYSYIFILNFTSGVFILFALFLTLISQNTYNTYTSNKYSTLSMIIPSIILTIYIIWNSSNPLYTYNNSFSIDSFTDWTELKNFYIYPNNNILNMSIILLFFYMIYIMKICSSMNKPLRSTMIYE